MNITHRRVSAPFATALGVAVGLAMLTALVPVASGDTLVAPEYQAAIFARVLAHDRALTTKAVSQLTVGLLFRQGHGSSLNMKTIEAFGALSATTIEGIDFALRSRAFRNLGDLADWVDDHGVDVIYVSPGLEDEMSEVAAFCRDRKLVAISPVEAFVREGLPIGVVLRDKKAKVLVNLPAAQSVGIDLPEEVMALAEVIR